LKHPLALSLVLGFPLMLAVGCGGGSGGSGAATHEQASAVDKRPIIGGQLLGNTTNCLIDENWLVQPQDNEIQGTSAAGLQFTMHFYPSVGEAKKHGGKKKVVVENAVFDYGATGGQNIGVNITTTALTTETKTIKKCLAVARS
jgi:hypothetical protein